jgi:predicted transcriptional regulator
MEDLSMATLVEIAAQIVASHASSTPMTSDQLIFEIGKVHSALKNLEAGEPIEGAEEAAAPKTSMSVKEAFRKGEVVCMVCGKGGLKPGEYKKQFGIPSKQSLSAKNYSEARRKMAQDRGLAENLAKAREVRMANLEAKKTVPAKPAKAAKAGKGAKRGPKAKVVA